MSRKMPTKPGFYWAKVNKECKDWYIIVFIEGDSPFLHYKAWNFTTGTVEVGNSPTEFIFGPKIREAKSNAEYEL